MQQSIIIPVALAGVKAWSPSEGDLPTGVYVAQVTSASIEEGKSDKQNQNLVLTHKILNGYLRDADKQIQTYVGRERKMYIPIPNGRSENRDKAGKEKLRAHLESIGYNPADIDQVTNLDVNAYILGKQVYLFNVESTAAVEGDISAITQANYQQYEAGTWNPNEAGKPRKDRPGFGDGAGGLPGVGAVGNMPGAGAGQVVAGVNPLTAGAVAAVAPNLGTVPAATTAAPGMAQPTMGQPQPNGPNGAGAPLPTLGAAAPAGGFGQLVS